MSSIEWHEIINDTLYHVVSMYLKLCVCKLRNVPLLTLAVSLRYCLLVGRWQELGCSQCREAAAEQQLVEPTVLAWWTALTQDASQDCRYLCSAHHSQLVCTGLYVYVDQSTVV